MDKEVIGLIVGVIICFSIAVMNEFMPFEQQQMPVRGYTPKGEKGVFTTTLVKLGIMKSRNKGNTRRTSHTGI